MSAVYLLSLGYLIAILLGTLLLLLPFSSKSGEPVKLLDALFTATSATCVTGLVVVDTCNYWSTFGQTYFNSNRWSWFYDDYYTDFYGLQKKHSLI